MCLRRKQYLTQGAGKVSAQEFVQEGVSADLDPRGFGSPRIWIPHPKTLADLDDPKREFGSPAD